VDFKDSADKTRIFVKIRIWNSRTFFVSKTRFVLKFKSCQPFSHFHRKKVEKYFLKLMRITMKKMKKNGRTNNNNTLTTGKHKRVRDNREDVKVILERLHRSMHR